MPVLLGTGLGFDGTNSCIACAMPDTEPSCCRRRYNHTNVSKKFAYTCVDMESLLTENFHVKLFKRMGFDQPLDFENGDDGPSGGVQMLCPVPRAPDCWHVARMHTAWHLDRGPRTRHLTYRVAPALGPRTSLDPLGPQVRGGSHPALHRRSERQGPLAEQDDQP
eukprot:3894668-Rhodomonas_salina.1